MKEGVASSITRIFCADTVVEKLLELRHRIVPHRRKSGVREVHNRHILLRLPQLLLPFLALSRTEE